jgi:hypothetical protein
MAASPSIASAMPRNVQLADFALFLLGARSAGPSHKPNADCDESFHAIPIAQSVA